MSIAKMSKGRASALRLLPSAMPIFLTPKSRAKIKVGVVMKFLLFWQIKKSVTGKANWLFNFLKHHV
ncbi:hypothetical protein [Moraxella lacunata]|uniref:hypothetical protein n=1 Tax=Moraxella lacunata TaxID=477 RepID=UPI003EE27D7E